MMGGIFGQGKGFRDETGKGVVPVSGTVRNKGGTAHDRRVEVHQSKTQKEIRSVHKEG
jgi:hypothetical protein